MSFDIYNAALVAGGEAKAIPSVKIEGLQITPPVGTLCSQATGDDATVLRVRTLAGFAQLFGTVKEFAEYERAIKTTSGAAFFASGEACWFTGVVVRHRNAASTSIVFVEGTVAALASVAKPTWAEIKSYLGLGESNAVIGIIGDIRFHRSADTVIDVMVDHSRRSFGVDENDKVMLDARDLSDPTTLTAVPGGWVDLPANLTSLSAVTPGNLAVDGSELPKWPYGGKINHLEYIGGQAGANSGADITVKAQIDGVAVVGADLNLTLANTALPSRVASAVASSANSFQPGDTLDLEVDAVGTAFTAGTGIIRVHLDRYE